MTFLSGSYFRRRPSPSSCSGFRPAAAHLLHRGSEWDVMLEGKPLWEDTGALLVVAAWAPQARSSPSDASAGFPLALAGRADVHGRVVAGVRHGRERDPDQLRRLRRPRGHLGGDRGAWCVRSTSASNVSRSSPSTASSSKATSRRLCALSASVPRARSTTSSGDGCSRSASAGRSRASPSVTSKSQICNVDQSSSGLRAPGRSTQPRSRIVGAGGVAIGCRTEHLVRVRLGGDRDDAAAEAGPRHARPVRAARKTR